MQNFALISELTLKQLEHLLGQLVGLGHHRRASLLQNLRTAQVGSFSRKVGIHDAATRSREVLGIDAQIFDCGFKATLNRAQIRAGAIDGTQGSVHGHNGVVGLCGGIHTQR